jgi:hypothetical protein
MRWESRAATECREAEPSAYLVGERLVVLEAVRLVADEQVARGRVRKALLTTQEGGYASGLSGMQQHQRSSHRVQTEGLVRHDKHLWLQCGCSLGWRMLMHAHAARRACVCARGDRNCVTLWMTSARVDSASGVVRTRPLSHFSHSESLQPNGNGADAVRSCKPLRSACVHHICAHQLETSDVGQTMMTRLAVGCPSMP